MQKHKCYMFAIWNHLEQSTQEWKFVEENLFKKLKLSYWSYYKI